MGDVSERRDAPGSRFAHVVFDLDGTLVDSADGIARGIQYALHALGEPTRDPGGSRVRRAATP